MSAYSFSNSSAALPHLLDQLLKYGNHVPSRNGDSKELRAVQVQLTNPGNGYIVTPGRKASVVAQVAEAAWVLAGRNDIEWLSRYLPRAADFSDDGVTWRGGYGPRIRRWAVGEVPQVSGAYTVDQLYHVVEILREDPNSRRAVITLYDPAIDTDPGKDIPCNNWLHFLGRGGILDLNVSIRSNDLMWGWSGINAFEWNVLLQVVAGMLDMEVGTITFNISSLHLYERHYDRAQKIVDASAGPSLGKVYAPSPRFSSNQVQSVKDLDVLLEEFFAIEALIRQHSDVGDVGLNRIIPRIQQFPEVMLRSWLDVLLYWNTRGKVGLPAVLKKTDLEEALLNTPERKPDPTTPAPVAAEASPFLKYVQDLHAEKDAAYGDSWCRRGEQMAIMANIARKVDRLGVAGAGDTASDTAIDMAVYLVKYSIWYQMQRLDAPEVLPLTGPEHVKMVSKMLSQVDALPDGGTTTATMTENIKRSFDRLEEMVTAGEPRGASIQLLAQKSWALARRLWQNEQDWKAANATRPFNGYNDLEGEEVA